MKAISFVLVSVLFFLFMEPPIATATTKNESTTNLKKRPKKKIVFNGTWKRWIKSLVPSQQPIEGWVDEDRKELTLDFLENVGNVEVSITTSSGETLYQQLVNTAETSSLVILLKEEDEYILSVRNNFNIILSNFNI